MKRLLTAFVCCLVAGGAGAWDKNDWLAVGVAGDMAVFVRAADEITIKATHTFWTAWVNSTPSKPYDLELVLYRANCDTGMYQNQAGQSVAYLRGIRVGSDATVSNWQYPLPGSVGESIFDVVCRDGKPVFGSYKVDNVAFNLVPIGKKILRELQVR